MILFNARKYAAIRNNQNLIFSRFYAEFPALLAHVHSFPKRHFRQYAFAKNLIFSDGNFCDEMRLGSKDLLILVSYNERGIFYVPHYFTP